MLKKLVSVFIILLSISNIALAETNIKNCNNKCIVIEYKAPFKEVEYITSESLQKALLIIENGCFIDSFIGKEVNKSNELICKINSKVVDLKTNMVFNGVALIEFYNLKYNDINLFI